MRRSIVISLVLLILAGLAGWGLYARAQQGGEERPERPIPVVLVAPVGNADVPVHLEGVGSVEAYRTVDIRPQIDGKLLELAFSEGQDVDAGDLLALIDPAPYKAAYDEAVANKARDQATLANAKLDEARYERLSKSDYATRQEADQARALVAETEAQILADEAAIDSAAAELAYTRITSPIDGRTGIRNVDVGNIVRTSDTDPIVTVTQLQPISVLFTLPEIELSRVSRAAARGEVVAEAFSGGARELLDTGTLEVIDNRVDDTTGTIRIKATFANAELQLWPGQFVNVRLRIDTLPDAIVVPAPAVQQGPTGTYVYVLDAGQPGQERVVMRNVTVAREEDGRAVITAGVQPGEQVVTAGFVRLTDDARVRVGDPATQPAPEAAS
ncbi:efflux RND transporter periplasmic adaptor subunit [Marinivivus vitaminiproducens]|uniref:efflux RND transporter periplasmic adaptor subunit n=1 Tax=Marinivivus vitaminiproducens TaxID=3035935 RepID=UPI00279C4FB0|nr:efflux RND transporter periplasmic adaptor subunit [Geminicoccaceae bacterium SCSIO 64248]